MKNLDKRWLLFLVLILVLATGLPYLSLNQEASITSDMESEDVQSMSIALVNEDQGAVFNGSELTFGEAFVRSLDSNDEHEWFVVSRGVAESGLNRNTYDMMIVIPNDFSEKALSIDSESPEQVVLNYQINASDDENVRAEAERTASTILNEFNRRIIDVYFASIIGNLQDAQDNIGEIVEKQTQHTTTYNNDINNPLSNYTNQFGTIKDNTQVSRDSFGGLEDLLEGFEDRLSDGAEQKQGYLSDLDEFASAKEGNVNELLTFSDALLQFDQQLNSQDADEQFQQLQAVNEFLNGEFEQQDQGAANIVAATNNLREGVQESVQRAERLSNYLDSFDHEVAENVETYLDQLFRGVFTDDVGHVNNHIAELESELKELREEHGKLYNIYDELYEAYDGMNNQLHAGIKDQIEELPTMSKRAINKLKKLGLSNEKADEMKNVIDFTELYIEKFDKDKEVNVPEKRIILKEEMKTLKKIYKTGITVTDHVELPENDIDSGVFKITKLPDNFTLESLTLELPNEESITTTNKEVDLPENLGGGEFSVTLNVKLEENSEVDVFNPITWEWLIDTEEEIVETEEVTDDDSYATVPFNQPQVASISVDNSDGQNDEQDFAENGENGHENHPDEEPNEEVDPEEPENENTEIKSGNQDGTEGEADPTPGVNDADTVKQPENNGDVQDDDDPEEKIIRETVTIVNNTIRHQVMDPVYDKPVTELMNAIVTKVSEYDKLLSLYEMYFDDFNLDEGIYEELDKYTPPSFEELEEFKGITIDYIVAGVKDEITAEKIALVQEHIRQFVDFANVIDENIEPIVERIQETSQQAAVLNSSLEETLDHVANWREQSLNLLDQHGVVQENDMGEQQAILTLGNNFQPLLSESQSIAEQAQGNLGSAESVYQTLDRIDGQADTIEQSGEELVTRADQLSTEMTEKMMEDQDFADNFSDVLANSRVGDRQNENLYNFLSNPVQTSNQGTITSGDSFTPYFLVLTIFIVVLFTAYVISTLHQKRTEGDQFAQEKSLMGTNTPITLVTAGIGALEGIAIGVISSYLLQIGEGSMVLWTVLVTALITGMLLVATYLLRQLKMIGMFVLLIVMSMYLFLTNAFGAGIAGLEHLQAYSPLQYVESLLLQAVQGNANYLLAMLVISAIIVIGALANLFVLTREEKGDLKNEGSEEAS